jgi:benzodiazapine receptor
VKKLSSESTSLLKAANILAFILTVLVNGLAGSTTLIGGKTTADISDLYPTLLTPAGYVFAIWGIIYILLGAFVIYQARRSQKEAVYQKRISWLFVASSLLNITWLFLWQNEILSLSVVIMFLLLASLITIYLRLNIGKAKVPSREKLAVHLPFSVYLGWITIASIANVAAFLVSINWDGFGISQETWAILIIIVALLISLVVVATRKDVAYALVIIWALVGIAAKQSSNPNIVVTGEASAVILGVAIIVVIVLAVLKRR